MADESYFESAARIEESDRERALAMREEARRREREEAEQLRAAGGKRLCQDCGDPISARRLKAVPHARRCAGCQSDDERRVA